MNCELKVKCHGYATIVNDMPATTVVAPNSLNQITTISTPHFMTVTTTTINTASNPMVNQTGVGKSSIKQKRHISSNFSSTTTTTTPTAFVPTTSVMQSNQHMNLYDVEIINAPTDSITTTPSDLDDVSVRRFSGRRQVPTKPYTMEKLKRKG